MRDDLAPRHRALRTGADAEVFVSENEVAILIACNGIATKDDLSDWHAA